MNQQQKIKKITLGFGADTGLVLATFPGGPPARGTLLGGGPAERARWSLLGNGRNAHETLAGATQRMAWSAACAGGVAARGLAAAQTRTEAVAAAEKDEREQLLRGGMSLSGPRAATSCLRHRRRRASR